MIDQLSCHRSVGISPITVEVRGAIPLTDLLTGAVAHGGRNRYGGLAKVHVLLRNPQVELVPCRQRPIGPGVTETSKTMEGGTST